VLVSHTDHDNFQNLETTLDWVLISRVTTPVYREAEISKRMKQSPLDKNQEQDP
jgi:hypothetical protein